MPPIREHATAAALKIGASSVQNDAGFSLSGSRDTSLPGLNEHEFRYFVLGAITSTAPRSPIHTAPISTSPRSATPRGSCANHQSGKCHHRAHDPDYIPRPRNAFICFRSHFTSSAKASGDKHFQPDLSKDAGHAWRSMTEEEKRPFREMAAAEKIQHAIDYPNYVYSPAAPGRVQRAKPKRAPAVKRGAITAQVDPSTLPLDLAGFPLVDSEAFSDHLPYALNDPLADLNAFGGTSLPSDFLVDACRSLLGSMSDFVPSEVSPSVALDSFQSTWTPVPHSSGFPLNQESELLIPGLWSNTPNDYTNAALPFLPESDPSSWLSPLSFSPTPSSPSETYDNEMLASSLAGTSLHDGFWSPVSDPGESLNLLDGNSNRQGVEF